MKYVLYRVVNVVKFLATRGLASRGSEENICSQTNGNILGIIEFILQYDPVLARTFSQILKFGLRENLLFI